MSLRELDLHDGFVRVVGKGDKERVVPVLGAAADALGARGVTLRDLPENERMAWRAMFDHYLFGVNGPAMEHIPPDARGLFGERTPEQEQRLRQTLAQSLLR